MNARTTANDRAAFERAHGLKPNVSRIAYTIEAAVAIATHHGMRCVPTATYGVSGPFRSWIGVECHICGQHVDNGQWDFEHIDESLKIAKDHIDEYIAKGNENVANIKFACKGCNLAKEDERRWRERVAKARGE